MTEPEKPKSMDDAGRHFIEELLRHFHQDPLGVPQDPEEAAAA